MIILGVDPGTATTGYAVIKIHNDQEIPEMHDCSCVVTPAGVDMHKRLQMIHRHFLDIAEEHRPDVMVIERLFFNTNAKTAMSVGQARGVPLLVAAAYGMDVIEYTALQAKREIAGHGRANKKEMQEAVKNFMKFESIIKPDDANDALALALCFLSKDYREFVKKFN